MCDPVSLAIAAGSTLASSKLQSMAQGKVNKARSSAMTAEQGDLANYRQKAIEALGTSQDAASRPALDAATQAAQDQRTQDYSSAIKPEDLLPGQGNASQAVRQSIVSSLGTGAAKNEDTAAKRAVLDGYGDANFGRDVAMNRAGQQINTQGNFAAGRANVLPVELAAANHKGDSLQTMAGLVQGLGTAASLGYGAKVPASYANINQGFTNTAGNYIKGAAGYYGPGF